MEKYVTSAPVHPGGTVRGEEGVASEEEVPLDGLALSLP